MIGEVEQETTCLNRSMALETARNMRERARAATEDAPGSSRENERWTDEATQARRHAETWTARFVLPGEDPDAARELFDRLIEQLKPRDAIEEAFVESIFHQSQALDRAKGSRSARRTKCIVEALKGEEVKVATLGHCLFFDPRGHTCLYGSVPFTGAGDRTSRPPVGDERCNPAWLVEQLESTLTGSRWLLERWAELRENLALPGWWGPDNTFMMVRLIGRQPLDSLDVWEVAEIFLASHTLGPGRKHAFIELRSELSGSEMREFMQRVNKKWPAAIRPRDAATGLRTLVEIVERATARLNVIASELQKRSDAGEFRKAAGLAFDESPESEQIVRAERGRAEAMNESLDALRKYRRDLRQ
jgi:hypothetical protein